MLNFILLVLLGPPAIVLLVSVLGALKILPAKLCRRITAPVRNLQQPPWWVRHVMGSSFSLPRFVVWAWLISMAYLLGYVHLYVRFLVCAAMGHKFDKTYGEDRDGSPSYYCSRCFRWKSGRGFCE